MPKHIKTIEANGRKVDISLSRQFRIIEAAHDKNSKRLHILGNIYADEFTSKFLEEDGTLLNLLRKHIASESFEKDAGYLCGDSDITYVVDVQDGDIEVNYCDYTLI